MTRHIFIAALTLSLLNGCATTSETDHVKATSADTATAAAQPVMNDYPTRDRVDYVLDCVAKHGGLTYISQYACGCKIDKIAEKLTFEEYEAARTFTFMQKTPGEQGAPFRDPKHAKDLKKVLKEADEAAEKACFVK